MYLALVETLYISPPQLITHQSLPSPWREELDDPLLRQFYSWSRLQLTHHDNKKTPALLAQSEQSLLIAETQDYNSPPYSTDLPPNGIQTHLVVRQTWSSYQETPRLAMAFGRDVDGVYQYATVTPQRRDVHGSLWMPIRNNENNDDNDHKNDDNDNDDDPPILVHFSPREGGWNTEITARGTIRPNHAQLASYFDIFSQQVVIETPNSALSLQSQPPYNMQAANYAGGFPYSAQIIPYDYSGLYAAGAGLTFTAESKPPGNLLEFEPPASHQPPLEWQFGDHSGSTSDPEEFTNYGTIKINGRNHQLWQLETSDQRKQLGLQSPDGFTRLRIDPTDQYIQVRYTYANPQNEGMIPGPGQMPLPPGHRPAFYPPVQQIMMLHSNIHS